MTMTNPVSSMDRLPANDDKSQLPKKRPEINLQSKVVSVFIEADFQLITKNHAAIATRTFKELYPKVREGKTYYIKVAHFIYPVVHAQTIKSGHLFVNEVQLENMISYMSPPAEKKSVQIRSVNLKQIDYLPLQHAVFTILPWGEAKIAGPNKGYVHIDVDILRSLITSQYKGHFLEIGQGMLIRYPDVGFLCLNLTEQTYNDTRVPDYGRLTAKTRLDFICNSSVLAISRSEKSSTIEKFCFQVVDVRQVSHKIFSFQSNPYADSWAKGTAPLPLMIPFPALSSELRKKIKHVEIALEQEEEIRYGQDCLLTLKLSKVELKDREGSEHDDIDIRFEHNYEKSFTFQEKAHTLIIEQGNIAFLTHSPEHARLAERATFVILAKDIEQALDPNEQLWVNGEELEEFIQKNAPPMTIDGKLVAPLSTGKFLIKLERAFGNAAPEFESPLPNLKDLWSLKDVKEIGLRADPTAGISLVDSDVINPLKKIKVKVQLPFDEVAKKRSKKFLKEEELKQLFLDSMPKILLDNHRINAITNKGDKIIFTIEDAEFEGDEAAAFYGRLYKYCEETQIKFTADKSSGILIYRSPHAIPNTDIKVELQKRGVAALSEPSLRYLHDAHLSQTEYKEFYEALGVQPERGALIYGPPGGGKTELARKYGEFLSDMGFIVDYYAGSSFWSKYLGDSEKAIRDIFQLAREAQESLGKKSPRFGIFIDEIDAFLGTRENAKNRYETSVVTTFIAEMDGIAGKDGKSLNNVFVIGITNYPDTLDESVLRPGRLGTHIEIGIPNSQGRRDIFEIHTKKFKEKNHFAEDFERIADWVVEATIGKTGAFIKGLVTKTFAYMIDRLCKQRVSKEEVLSHPAGKLYLNDFVEAYKEMLRSDVKEKAKYGALEFKIPDRVHYQEIKQQLLNLGIGAVSKAVLGVLQDIMLTRFHYKTELNKLGYQFPRGLLIHGSKGTGKSKLVKALPQLFGLDSERFQYYQASQLWQQYRGNLRDEMKKIFEPSKQAAIDLGKESPLYVVVIEDIDRLYALNKDEQNKDANFIEEFLAELEDILVEQSKSIIYQNGSESARNLLVVATITNSEELGTDLAFYGRFGVHVRMSLPDAQGREELFNINLKEWKEKGLLDENVNIDRMVELTSDRKRNGEFIQGVVTKAITHPLRRAGDAGIEAEDFPYNPICKLTQEDLEASFHEMETDSNWESHQHMFS